MTPMFSSSPHHNLRALLLILPKHKTNHKTASTQGQSPPNRCTKCGKLPTTYSYSQLKGRIYYPNSVHTLRYFYTSSFQVPNFSKYVSVGYVNDLQIIHYDSDTKKLVPKQEWMNKLTEEDPRYWERNTQRCLENEQAGKGNIETVKRRLNVTGGLCRLQKLYGSEWDNETSEIRGYEQHSFDGEDFISLDFDPETFVAPKQQAFITKLIWERDGEAVKVKHYIIHECAEYLKKYVRHGESALNRIELPLVSLLQKSSSAPVTCHATGFYLDRAMLFWTKDGDELLEDVELGEILPNRDGTFQTSVSLDLSFVPPEDWDRYHCAFQLSGDKNKYLTRLDRCMIRNNEELHSSHLSCVGCSRCCSHCCCPCCGHLHLPNSPRLITPSEPEVQELNPQPPVSSYSPNPTVSNQKPLSQTGSDPNARSMHEESAEDCLCDNIRNRYDVLFKAVGSYVERRWEPYGSCLEQARALLELAKADKPLMRVTGTGPSPPLDYSGRHVSALRDFHSSSRAQELSAAPLQSLCRGVTRRALRPSPLEPKVWTLDLPLALKDYLLLSELWPILTVH
ncbi:MHC class I polypeptide-related sequence B-like [Periophthalmus magnuspinnatus]|uniref:MHC class I polypeptide-related sequence B-like n=1 Tax=Periophthalmus magnuspinnatus TaxID=409849 RepID=UPI0024366FC8|nr:MHC class I polypeptide-related sequence B-like [Periophthalmus magnuspinnatus]